MDAYEFNTYEKVITTDIIVKHIPIGDNTGLIITCSVLGVILLIAFGEKWFFNF